MSGLDIYVYIYIYAPRTRKPLFLNLQLPKRRPKLQSKQGHLGSRYILILYLQNKNYPKTSPDSPFSVSPSNFQPFHPPPSKNYLPIPPRRRGRFDGSPDIKSRMRQIWGAKWWSLENTPRRYRFPPWKPGHLRHGEISTEKRLFFFLGNLGFVGHGILKRIFMGIFLMWVIY